MNISHLIREPKQKETGRRFILLAALVLGWAGSARGQASGLDAGGLMFRDFAVADRGASLYRPDPTKPGGSGTSGAHVLEIDTVNGLARLRFDPVKVDVAVPLGWQAAEDSERGVAYNADHSYRLIVWRLDFAFEGVNDAEQYAMAKIGTIEARRPPAKARARKLADGSYLIAYENVPPGRGDAEPRAVFDLVIPSPNNPKIGVLMTLGVPGSQGERGLRLLALLREKIKITW